MQKVTFETKIKRVIIFGTNQLAQLADFYLGEEPEKYEVIAFTCHSTHKTIDTYCDKPVVAFEKLTEIYSPIDYYLFAPMTGKGMNKVRERVYNEGKSMGYSFITFIHERATVLTDKIGDNCFILEDNTIQPFVTIGNNCIFWSGNHIGHHSVIGDHAFFTSHVVLSGNCKVENYCWFGVNATIRDNLHIAEGSLLSMGSCLTKDTEPYMVYLGVPAKSKCRSDIEEVGNNL